MPTMKKENVTITFESEQLAALEFSLKKKSTSVQAQLEELLKCLYESEVPEPVREYLASRTAPAARPRRPASTTRTTGRATTFPTISTRFPTPNHASNRCIASPTGRMSSSASPTRRIRRYGPCASEVSAAGTGRNSTGRRRRSASPTTCSR